MNESDNAPENTRSRPKLSVGRMIVIGLFGLLCLGFAFRLVQYGISWISGRESADLNYGALTVWSLIYTVVCAGIAALAWWMPAEEEAD
jgi:di/tricarboxylate transporter